MKRNLFFLCYLAVILSVVNMSLVNILHAEDWKLSGGTGRRLPDETLELTGNGSDSNAWLSEPVDVEAGKTYRFSMEACSPTGGGGCAPCGLSGFSRDRTDVTKAWKPFSYVFRAPYDRPSFQMRVAQWNSAQTYQFRKMKVEPAETIHKGVGSTKYTDRFLRLGAGEILRGDVYRFDGFFGGEGSNAHRVFFRTNAGFNSNRFTVGGDREIVYRFALNCLDLGNQVSKEFDWEHFVQLLSGSIEVNVNYHVRGDCFVDVCPTPNGNWQEIGKLDGVGTLSARIPESYFPAKQVFVRIRGGKDASFQVDRIFFEAAVTPDEGFAGVGETIFADVLPQTEKMPEGYSSRPLFFDEHRSLYVLHANDSDKPVKPVLTNPPNRMSRQYQSKFFTISEPFDAQTGEMPPKSICFEAKPKSKAPEYQVPFSDGILKYSFPFQPYRDADFGYCIPDGVSKDTSNAVSNEGGSKALDGIWWVEPDWKVSPDKAAPEKTASSFRRIRIFAAKNDLESFQLVVNGAQDGRQNVLLTLEGDLQGSDGAEIAASNVQIRYAYYHFVHRPTDGTGSVGYWPDALPPLEKPIDIPAGKNQPFWITVSVPENAEAGNYQGRLKITSIPETGNSRYEISIPFELNVWNFALPKKNTLRTAFGRNIWRAFEYHNVKSDEDRRSLLELYHKLYSDNRISVYDPTPLDPIRVSWNKENLKAEIDFSAWDKEMQRVVDKYNITGFRLAIQGMGGGTFESRRAGKILDFDEGTPEYEALFSDYVKQLESHLREKGRLDMAYVYWFDEPEPKDYEFVADGFAKLQKHAPGLARMITEESNAGFIEAMEKAGAKIDIWCPVTYHFNEDDAKKRQQLGERFWWYVCCGPHAPYCTLFIDHPSIELRLWHWQAWKYGVVGSLVWESNYWTSPTAFPKDSATPYQNPYEDPMSYVSGGPSGSKRYWGNGDGRFVYPPLEAALPGRNDGKPMLKAPVSSIRMEMLREGIEDYEMMNMLREWDRKHQQPSELIENLLIVPAGITSSLTEFTTDPAPMYQRRQRIAEMIEKQLAKEL